jgi:hypothetical protein
MPRKPKGQAEKNEKALFQQSNLHRAKWITVDYLLCTTDENFLEIDPET